MLSVAAFSSSEDEEEYTAVELNDARRELRQQSNIYAMPDSKFIKYFRLNKSAFKYVLEKITPKFKQPTRSTCLPNILKLAATMRILAEGSYQKGAGNDLNVSMSQSSVSNVFQECIDVMYNELCKEWISFPTEENQMYEIKEYFFNKTGFPGVIGCIDGTHINIISPEKEEQFKYRNTKGFFSLNATVVCDHKLRIRYLSAHHQGSVYDSLVWNISDMRQFLREKYDNGERNTWLLGDAGYPLENFLIAPFRSPESRFNYIHERTRNVVERTIGVLKNRFRCILHYKPDMATKLLLFVQLYTTYAFTIMRSYTKLM